MKQSSTLTEVSISPLHLLASRFSITLFISANNSVFRVFTGRRCSDTLAMSWKSKKHYSKTLKKRD